MTVAELMNELADMNPDAAVRLAMQPRWAFEYSVGAVVEVPAVADESIPEEERPTIVYLSEGAQLGYLPGYVSEELGWK
jgi:hypothetical protein